MSIRKIFDKVFDEEVHIELLKFGKGEFREKYLIDAKKQADKYVIKTGAEFANHLVKMGLEKAHGKVKITGVIVSTMHMDIPFSKDIKQFMGIKQYKVDTEIESSQVLEAMEKFPRAFFALSFVLPDYELKIKPKAPKSAKPSTKGEGESKAEFCSLKTTDSNVVKDMLFGLPDFKMVSVKHTLKIDQIVYPRDFTKMKPEEVREQSKRKGVIIRNVVIDGRVEKSEAPFEA
jgi:hypothetical protein